VGVAPDKMAAFLSEMKTVRLRKVNGGVPSRSVSAAGSSASGSGSGELARSASVGQGSFHHSAVLRRKLGAFSPSASVSATSSFRSFENGNRDRQDGSMDEARVGEKRKRDGSGRTESQGDLRSSSLSPHQTGPRADLYHPFLYTAMKRPSVASSSDSSFASTSASSQYPPSTSTMSGPSSFSQVYRPSRIHIPHRTWPPNSTTDTATPSLCSDNDIEREDDTSLDDRLPSTPPIAPSHHATHPRETQTETPSGNERLREEIDIDMEMDDPPPVAPLASHPISPYVRRINGNLFAKRPPTSPMPAHSPRKPRPPARASRTMPPPPPIEISDDEDPLSLSFTSPLHDRTTVPPGPGHPEQKQDDQKQAQPTASQQPSVASAAPAASHTSSRSKRSMRRQTLDEELRDARERLIVQGDSDLESGVFVGVGTRNKGMGFLAHGGAGGTPVFTGVRYVEGAEEGMEEDEGGGGDDDEYQPRKRRSGKSAGTAKRRGKR